jgi:hypothetical protein
MLASLGRELSRVIDRGLGEQPAPFKHVLHGILDNVGQIEIRERRRNYIEDATLHCLQIMLDLTRADHDDDIYRSRRSLRRLQDVRPRAIGHFGIGENQVRGFRLRHHGSGLSASPRSGYFHESVRQHPLQAAHQPACSRGLDPIALLLLFDDVNAKLRLNFV